jgi:hypothetical protein
MKIFSGAKGRKLDRASARACVGINLLATPGLGSIIAGRYFAGMLQLLLACAGFALVLWWYFYEFQAILGSTSAGHNGLWQGGLAFFGAGWLGSLWSSLGILREADEKTPPKLDGSAG